MDLFAFVARWDAVLRFHYRIDPDTLDDKEWVNLVSEYQYVRELESKRFRQDMELVLYELAGKIYG